MLRKIIRKNTYIMIKFKQMWISAWEGASFFKGKRVCLDNYKDIESKSRVAIFPEKYGIIQNTLMMNYLTLMMGTRLKM